MLKLLDFAWVYDVQWTFFWMLQMKKSDGKVYTDGPLIHNPQVLEYLEKRDIHIVNGQTDLSKSTVVIRAHGITPTRRKEIEDLGAKVCDATCPHVMRVQSIIKKYAAQGYSTVIVGDKGHAEVVGLLGYAEGKGHVVQELDEIEQLAANGKGVHCCPNNTR